MARNGVSGVENDFRLETSIYSFRTEAVKQPVIIFAGGNDKVLPLEVSRHVHRRLDNAHLRVIQSVGHLGLLRDEVLRDLFETVVTLAEEGRATREESAIEMV